MRDLSKYAALHQVLDNGFNQEWFFINSDLLKKPGGRIEMDDSDNDSIIWLTKKHMHNLIEQHANEKELVKSAISDIEKIFEETPKDKSYDELFQQTLGIYNVRLELLYGNYTWKEHVLFLEDLKKIMEEVLSNSNS